MAANGIRDGYFIRFEGWDFPEHDIALYQELSGWSGVSQLKEIALSKPGYQVYAFNTFGWLKAWGILDWTEFRQVRGCDLYVRVDYPGWHFFQGQDSRLNDIARITDVSTATALTGRVSQMYPNHAENQRVAAVNTQGWIKSRVDLPLTQIPGATSSLQGIYVRTEFRWYTFFPLYDSNGNDIRQERDGADHIADLIRACEAHDDAIGFNTNGWIKRRVLIPPPVRPPGFTRPTQGLYVRVSWPDFVFLPDLDSRWNDIIQYPSMTTAELVMEARKDSSIVAFNSDGWMKRAVAEEPSEFIPPETGLNGVYIKTIIDLDDEDSSDEESNKLVVSSATKSILSSTEDSTAGQNAFFVLKGTYMLWGKWWLNDARVRDDYARAVARAVQELVDEVSAGQRTWRAAARKAHQLRELILRTMRQRSSPFGLVIAEGIKTAGSKLRTYLDTYSQRLYNTSFRRLRDRAQMSRVMENVTRAAGRANRTITRVMRGLGEISKATIVIAAGVSIYEVTIADDWRYEIGNQVSSWAGAIAGGELGAGVGAILGPVGAVIGGIAGSMIGAVGAEHIYSSLANFFFGGRSDSSGMTILGAAYDDALKFSKERMRKSGRQFCVHVVLQSQFSAIHAGDKSEAASVTERMINTASLSLNDQSDDEVLATLVWIKLDDRYLPANAGNPEDFMTLMDWVYKNNPRTGRASIIDIENTSELSLDNELLMSGLD